jgi:hypothetical protein
MRGVTERNSARCKLGAERDGYSRRRITVETAILRNNDAQYKNAVLY